MITLFSHLDVQLIHLGRALVHLGSFVHLGLVGLGLFVLGSVVVVHSILHCIGHLVEGLLRVNYLNLFIIAVVLNSFIFLIYIQFIYIILLKYLISKHLIIFIYK